MFRLKISEMFTYAHATPCNTRKLNFNIKIFKSFRFLFKNFNLMTCLLSMHRILILTLIVLVFCRLFIVQ